MPTPTQTQITTYAIYRDDDTFMEGGWLNEDEAHTRVRHMYDPGEYEVRPVLSWVPVAEIPFYRPPRFRSIVWAWFTRQPTPEWEPHGEDPNPRERWWRRG